jgi:hypothetical protein
MLISKEKREQFLSNIPGTRLFKRRVWKYALRVAKKYRCQFENLDSIDEETKACLRSTVRHRANQLGMARMWQSSILFADFPLWVLIAILLLSMAVVGVASWIFGVNVNFEIFVTALVFFLFLLSAVFILLTPFLAIWAKIRGPLSPDIGPHLRLSALVLFQFDVIVALFLGWGAVVEGWVGASSNITAEQFNTIQAAVYTITVVVLWLEVTLGSKVIGQRIEQAWIRRKTPDALIVSNLVQILYVVESQSWTSWSTKNELLELLEEIAVTIEKGIRRSIRLDDAVTDSWLGERSRRMSAAMRELKKWVITPKADTREHFIEWIRRDLIIAVQGNWDAWEQAKPGKLTRKQWVARVYSVIRTLGIAFGPLALFYAVQQTPWALIGTPANTLTIIAFLWMVITLIAAFDPLFEPKIDAMKNVTDMLPFIGRSKQP